jgi:small redox-active disulfide protein 2
MLKIEVLDPGCTKYDDIYGKIRQVLDELEMEAELVKITDFFQIIDRGVSFTPALIIDGKLVFQSKVPTKDQIATLLRERQFYSGKQRQELDGI